jgi:DNA gyrase/topoisomerase IV subunit A
VADHWRLGLVERSVLETMDHLGARPDRPHVKCARIVQRLADELGVSPRYGYDSLCTMSQAWLLHLPLVDFHGNNGSADEYDRPANPRYTEARLSPAGAIALAADLGEGPRVPLALINGDLHVDGLSPPFSPTRVVATLLALSDDPHLTDEDIVERIGPPSSPTGCGVACDYVALAAGESTEMILTAQMNYEPVAGAQLIVLTHLPLGVGGDTVVQALAARVESLSRRDPDWDADEFAELALPLRDVQNGSYGDVTRIVCELREDAIPADWDAQIASTWGVSTRGQVQLRAPLAQLMRELVDEDLAAQRAALVMLSKEPVPPGRIEP